MHAGEGMSNRAIASVTGTVEGTVRNDLKAGAQNYAPAPVSDMRHEFPAAPEWSPDEGFVNESTGEVTAAPEEVASAAPIEPKSITGLDDRQLLDWGPEQLCLLFAGHVTTWDKISLTKVRSNRPERINIAARTGRVRCYLVPLETVSPEADKPSHSEMVDVDVGTLR